MNPDSRLTKTRSGLMFLFTSRKCQPEARLLHQPVHALPLGPIMSFFPPALSLLLSRSLSFLFLSVTAFLFQTYETTLYLHTSTNPESFRVPCFSIARVHAGLASADFRLPASGSFLSFCSSLSFSLWYARNINGHLCSRLTVDNFFLFCRWILCLLCFFSYFSFEINLPSSVST